MLASGSSRSSSSSPSSSSRPRRTQAVASGPRHRRSCRGKKVGAHDGGVLFELGNRATVTGGAVDLIGPYSVTMAGDDSVYLVGEGDRSLKLSPRHRKLRDNDGNELD